MYAAYFVATACFIARYGDWLWLYEDIPTNAEWIKNDRGWRRLSKEDIEYAILDRGNVTSMHFSSAEVQEEFN